MSTVLAQVTQPRGELATGCSPVGEYRSVRECQLRSENLYDIAPATPGRRTARAVAFRGDRGVRRPPDANTSDPSGSAVPQRRRAIP